MTRPPWTERWRARLPSGSLNLATLVGGNLARNGMRGLFKLLLFGFLAPQAMGVLRAVYAVFKITSSLVDLGLDHASVTFVSTALGRGDPAERDRVLGSVFSMKLILLGGMTVVGNLIAPWVAEHLLGDPSLTFYTRLAFYGVSGQLLWRYVSGCLAAHREFGKLALFVTTAPAIMLAAGGLLIGLERFDLTAGVVIHLFAPAVAVALWAPAVAPRFARLSWDGPTARRVLGFSRWVYVSSVASASRNHLNPILLKHPSFAADLQAAETQAGLYGLGADLAAEITVLSESLFTFLLPEAARKSSRRELRRFVRRAYRYILLGLPVLVLPIFVVRPLLEFLGRGLPNYAEYLPAVPVFMILWVGSLLSILSLPVQTALYAIGRPQLDTYLTLAGIPVLVLSALALIPRYGPQGAAVAILVQRVVIFGALMFYGRVALRDEE